MERTLGLLVVAMVATGCMGDAEETAASLEADAVEGAVVGTDGALLSPARFPHPDAIDVTTWSNGTFQAQDAGRPASPAPRASDLGLVEAQLVRVDITEHVPVGLPVRIIAQVDAALARGDVDIWLDAPAGERRTGNWDSPRGGYTRFEVGLVHVSSEPIVVVLAYDELEPAAEISYSLSVRVVADPTLLVNGIVTGVTLPADARLDVELVGEKREREFDEIAIMVFSPDDEFLGAFPLAASGVTQIQLPEGSPAGEYVMLLRQGGRNARLLVADAEDGAPMRALAQEFVVGQAVVGDSSGHAKWTAEYDRVPLLAGLQFRSANAGLNVAVKLEGPHGVLIDERIAGGPWVNVRSPDGSGISDGFGWDTAYAAPGLDAGTYTHEVTFETAAGPDNLQAFGWSVQYVR